jgi:hypothetical protein
MISLLSFFHCDRQIKLQWHEEKGYKWADLPEENGTQVGFEKLTVSRTGIDFENSLEKEQIMSNRHLFDGSGVALGDIDNDGLCDIYFCRLNGPNVLYRNKGNFKFEDITHEAGVAYADQFSKGALLVDIDGDRDLDLIITVLDGPNACFINDGSGNFTDGTEEAGLESLIRRTGNTSMAMGDIDGDNDLDLYMVCYKNKAWRDTEGASFNRTGRTLSRTDYGEPDILYLNDGKGHFENEKLNSRRFRRENGKPTMMPRGWGLTARMQDMDDDGDPDIYVCNDFYTPDFVWMNDGQGGFQQISRLAIRSTSLSSMTIDFSDIDRDGDLDFFVADMFSRDHQKRKMQMGLMKPVDQSREKIYSRPQIMRNTTFLNRGDGTYAEMANYARLHASDWTWSAIFMDVDLDGYEDLLTTTGHAYDVQDSDTDAKILQSKVRSIDELRQTIFMYPRLETPNFAFRNNGDLTFSEVGAEWGFDTNGISHGMAVADLDNDGDLDVVVNNYEAPAGIYRNESAAPRIAVRLRGSASNTHGIGAKIKLFGGPVVQSKEIIAGGQYLSNSEPIAVFAAGNARKNMKLEVVWRSGNSSVLENVQANRVYEIDESFADTATALAIVDSEPAFEDVSHLLEHFHHERKFDDFYYQPLLPNRLSQLGPGVSWFDLDDDLDDDLFIGSGRDGDFTIYRNEGSNGFKQIVKEKTEQDQTAILVTQDGSGKTMLLVGMSNYENNPESPAIVIYKYQNGGFEKDTNLPKSVSSTGPIALADYDNDGDLDLFVGGRVIPGRYPEPASSKLYINNNGKFIPDAVNSNKLEQLGLVSGAVFSDIDSDGDPDLVLATEWGPVRIFRNNVGKFSDATEELGLEEFTGWWNGVTTGDFNEDGQLDIVATNWGLNSKYHYDSNHPLKIYYGDFDNNGKVDVIEAHFDSQLKKTVPERGFSCMSNAMSFIRNNVNSYKQYGASTVGQIMGPDLQRADSVSASTLAHTLFLNRGSQFEAFSLPAEAQFAPAFYAGVADYDGDGHEPIMMVTGMRTYFFLRTFLCRRRKHPGRMPEGDCGYAAMGRVS